MNVTCNAIPRFVFNRLVKLTSKTYEKPTMKKAIYSQYTPMLDQIWVSSKSITKSKRSLESIVRF